VILGGKRNRVQYWPFFRPGVKKKEFWSQKFGISRFFFSLREDIGWGDTFPVLDAKISRFFKF
jgi:hypothetical protein